jgi:hypothetical protein
MWGEPETYDNPTCVNCGAPGSEECDACSRYRQRNGRPRPRSLWS